jgi:hypothetical protein
MNEGAQFAGPKQPVNAQRWGQVGNNFGVIHRKMGIAKVVIAESRSIGVSAHRVQNDASA